MLVVSQLCEALRWKLTADDDDHLRRERMAEGAEGDQWNLLTESDARGKS